MRVNPLVDLFGFWTSPSYGEPAFITFLYWIVALASFAVAAISLRKLEGQASGYHVGRFIVRFIVGSMWWQQALWKFPTDLGGLQYWTEQMAKHAAFPFHRVFVRDVILPHFAPIGTCVFFIEIAIGVSLMLGLLTRLSAFGGALFIANLWLGLYRVDRARRSGYTPTRAGIPASLHVAARRVIVSGPYLCHPTNDGFRTQSGRSAVAKTKNFAARPAGRLWCAALSSH
jgi:uncharacterized membrane protein YphA (DoxX/SURF4 family)